MVEWRESVVLCEKMCSGGAAVKGLTALPFGEWGG